MRKITLAGPALLLAAACGLATASPALADDVRSGPESATGVIVASGATGTRQVLFSVIHMHGVFDGTGRIVEVPNLPTDPDNVSRDDLVFPQGTISIKSTNLDFSATVDPKTCIVTAALRQTTEITGGTQRFAHATGRFSSKVDATGLLPRASDGSCDQTAEPLVEVDHIDASGRMTL
jgi:hypothetical protein